MLSWDSAIEQSIICIETVIMALITKKVWKLCKTSLISIVLVDHH